MNKKKLTRLLTGIVVASTIFTGCSSNNKKQAMLDDNVKIKRATERTITEYDEENEGNIEAEAETPSKQSEMNSRGTSDGEMGDSRVTNSTNDVDKAPMNESSNTNNTTDELNDFSTENNQSNDMESGNELNNSSSAIVDEHTTDNLNDLTMNNNTDNLNNFTNDSINNSPYTDNIYSPINEKIMVDPIPMADSYSRIESVEESADTQEVEQIDEQEQAEQYTKEDENNLNKVIGKLTPLRAVGGVELNGVRGRKKPHGTIQVSFYLSGDILNTEIPAAPGVGAAVSTQQQAEKLGDLIKKAYLETVDDANSGFEGKATITEREKLQVAMSEMFKDKSQQTKILLRDSKGQTITLPYEKYSIVPTKSVNPSYVRNIIDLDGMKATGKAVSKDSPASDIAISFMVRAKKATGEGDTELDTNAMYEFIGVSSNGKAGTILPVEKKEGKDYKVIGVVEGFNFGTCMTGRAPSTFTAKSQGSANALKKHTGSKSKKEPSEEVTDTNFYITTITKDIFLDTSVYKFEESDNVKSSGKSIKLTNILFKDPDESIVNVEMEDKYGTKYPCELVYKDVTKESEGKCIKVMGLKDKTPYTFTNIYVTSNTSGKDEVEVIQLGTAGPAKIRPNTSPATTAEFKEPAIKVAGGQDYKIDLPSGSKERSVKNDSTALRYILEVENSDDIVRDLRVTGLNKGEEYDIKKYFDKKSDKNFYILNLRNLSPSTDYGYLNLELDYVDYENNKGTFRTSLSSIKSTNPSYSHLDNTTEASPIKDSEAFVVDTVSSVTSSYARTAMVPVFIDDMHGRLKSISVVPSDKLKDITATYDGTSIRLHGLIPNTKETVDLEFIYTKADGTEDRIDKYVVVNTPLADELDINTDTANATATEANIKLDFAKTPKSPIKTVVVKDELGRTLSSSWDKSSDTLTLKGLEANKEYRGLMATFTLENALKVKYPLNTFKTTGDDTNTNPNNPTGKVAGFVERVYEVALGRKPELEGWNYWIEKLEKKEISASVFIAENLMTQKEFVERQLTKQQFVTTMYSLIVNREPDKDGQAYWERKYDEYRNMVMSIEELRIKIAREMMNESEFKELVTSIGLKY